MINGASLVDCYSSARAVSDASAGALVGKAFLNGSATPLVIQNCYATGLVTSTTSGPTGGLMGSNLSATVTSSYWDAQTTGQPTTPSVPATFGKTTLQMSMTDTFAGWDFMNTWRPPAGGPPTLVAAP